MRPVRAAPGASTSIATASRPDRRASAVTNAIRIHRTGGPEQLRWEQVEVGRPGPGEVRLRQAAVGLNFIDTYHRTGLYPLPGPMPLILGIEGAGVVAEIGSGVAGFAAGDRVSYAGPIGAYAEERLIAAERLIRLPSSIGFDEAAAATLRGLTAQVLLRTVYPVRAGDWILVHAAAGGTGLLLCQWAHKLGARVIGVVSSQAKVDLARAKGCTHPLLTSSDWVAEVRALTSGQGVAVVYDSVGRDSFLRSLDCLAVRGTMVSFGQSSGPADPVDPLLLARKGSLTLVRPNLFHYIAKRDELDAAAIELFDAIADGTLDVAPRQRFALADSAEAHRALEGRRTIGATVLTV